MNNKRTVLNNFTKQTFLKELVYENLFFMRFGDPVDLPGREASMFSGLYPICRLAFGGKICVCKRSFGKAEEGENIFYNAF